MMPAHESLAARRRSRHSSVASSQLGSFSVFWQKCVHIVRIILIGIFITAVITIGSFVYFVRAEIAQLRNAKIVFVSSDLDEKKNTITLAVIKDTQLELISFADTLTAEVGKHGGYQLRAVYPLMSQEKYPVHTQAALFSYIFEVGIDEVVSLAKTVETPAELRAQLFASGRAGRISLPRATALWWLLYTVDKDTPVVHQVASWEEWPAIRQKALPVTLIPNCSVAIINATRQSGLAHTFNRVLEQEGVEVVRVASTTQLQEVSSLIVLDKGCPQVLRKIQQIAPVEIPVYSDTVPERDYRAEVVVVIGEDIAAFNPQLTR